MNMRLSSGLLSVDQLTSDDVHTIMDRAEFYKGRFKLGKDKKVGGLNGRTMINMFFEPSTRTRISFEQAAKRMGMLVSNIIADASAMAKGESSIDTIRTLGAMNFDVVILRTPQSLQPYELSTFTDSAIINAGDGTNEHPTQALLDYFTIQKMGMDVTTIGIIGNLVHSRVAKSNVKLLTRMGYKVLLFGPEHWLPDLKEWDVENGAHIVPNMSVLLEESNVVMALRIQQERFSDTHRGGLLDRKEYNKLYGIKHGMLRDNQYLMHPGPVNRGVEIDEDLVYCPQSVILDQVENGVAVRSAILEQVLT